MESTTTTTINKVHLKLLVDRDGGRVLFGEARKDLIDFLLRIFSLPLGMVVTLLSKENMVGSLGSLYGSIQNLHESFLQPSADKTLILNPPRISTDDTNPTTPSLLFGDSAAAAVAEKKIYSCHKNFQCRGTYCNGWKCYEYVSDDPEAICPKCNVKLSRVMKYVEGGKGKGKGGGKGEEEGGYVKGVVTYMVMDDLEVKPMSSISSITLLNRFNIKDLGALEEVDAYLGIEEGLKLLRASLASKTVLTDVFLEKN